LEICNYYLILMSVDQFLLSADTTDLNYPEIRPTLDLNFARVKALDPRITFTRSSGGSYVGADGLIKYAGVNEARFDHDPSTGESLGLLVEESRTNLLLRSEEFDVVWTTFASSIESTILAPDGTMTGVKLKEDTTQNEHRVGQLSGGGTTTNAVTFSVFLKASERTKVRLAFSILNNWVGGGGAAVIFDLMAGTAIPNNSTPTNFSITPFPNGWYRCSITGTPITTITPNCVIFIYTTTVNYTGDGTSGIYVWGAQIEQGSFPTSYIPTQASTRTRAADIASITGKNFSDFYNPNEFTVFTSQRYINLFQGNSRHIAMFSDGTFLNRIALYIQASSTIGPIRSFRQTGSGNFNDELIKSTFIPNQKVMIAAAYSSNDSAATADGAPITRLVNRAMPNGINRFGFWRTFGAVDVINGTISRLTYFPKRLPNAQLQALTR
jgi:hypothetical protein